MATETTTTHSPGPWIAEPVPSEAYTDPDLEPLDIDDVFWISQSRAYGHVLATIHRYPEDQAEANARLMAAAPELLDILKVTAGNIRSLGPAGALGPLYEPYTVWLAAVEAAIAKAECRSPDDGETHVDGFKPGAPIGGER